MQDMSIKQLKYRKAGDVIDPEDDNVQIDNWNAQLSINRELNPDDPDVNQLIDQLKSIISRMSKVQYGDYVMSDLHNLFVDAWNLQKQINDELKAQLEYYEARIAELEAYRPIRFEKAQVLRASYSYEATIYLSRTATFRSEKSISGSISVRVVKE